MSDPLPPHDPLLLTVMLNVVGAMTVSVLWGFPSIFFHELGHTIAAKLLRLQPTHLVVGVSDSIFTCRTFGVEVVVRMIPFGGVTVLGRPMTSRLKAFLFVAAGPVSNALVILSAILLWQHTSMKAILVAVVFFEFIQIIYNLVPGTTVFDGVEIPRDGKRLLQILFGRFS